MKIRVGVIGAGTYGVSLIAAYHAAHRQDEIDFVAVADLNPAALAQMNEQYGLKGYLDYREMLDKEALDAVAIVTPDHLHKEITLEAAKRGIHLMVQKPLATDAQEGREMLKAAAEHNVMLYVDFHKRFDPGHIDLKRAIKAGKLGEIEYGYICMEDKILVPSEWFKTWAHKSSPAWFIGIHFYDLIYWLLEQKPIRVHATGQKKKLVSMGLDTYDALQAKFEFANGASITVDSSWIIPNSFSSIVNQQIRLVGTEGMQEVDSQDRGIVACYASDPNSLVLNPYGKYLQEYPFIGDVPSGYTIDSMLYFLKLIRMIKAGKTTLAELKGHYPDGEEALVSTIMCQAVHESARLGKPLDITY